MRKLERVLMLGAAHCLATLALAACGSEDNGTEGYNTNTSAATTGTPTAGTTGSTGTTGGPTTTVTSGTTGTTGATGSVGATNTTGDPTTTATTTTGTTGASVTTGTTGFGMMTAGAGGASSATNTTGNGTTGVAGATSTTGGEVFCDTMLSGEEYFKRPQGCAQCHGVDALGTDDDGPEVRHANADYLRWIVREGRMDHPDYPDGMPAVTPDCLTDQQIEEIIVFLDSFPQPTTGAELYADYCANCHGADGRGGVTEVSLDGELHENATVVAAGRNVNNYATRGAYMTPLGDHLTAQEIQMITDYLQNDLGFRF